MPSQQKRPGPTPEEIEERRKKSKAELPPGMSKNQWKKQQKDKRWEESKTEYRRIKKEKMKERKEELKKLGIEPEKVIKKPVPETQTKSDVNIIIDCDFDEYMNRKEITSLSNQITRAYSAHRHCDYELPLTISSFNKNLKSRFDTAVANYTLWKNIKFEENNLESLIAADKSQFVYLTADTDEIIDTLLPNTTYIIGGIVDKNRHKNLCLDKAKALGLKVGKLPIDKYIEINGRTVMATSHVYEICCKWFENNKNWEKAFNDVLPPRKIKSRGAKTTEGENDAGDSISENVDNDDEDESDDENDDENEKEENKGEENKEVNKEVENKEEENKEEVVYDEID